MGVEKLSRQLNLHLVKTSVKENLNISKVFFYLSSEHLDELSQWTEDAPLIQIGNSGFNSFTQMDFLTQYEKSLQLEVKSKTKNKSILKKKVNFCDTSCINSCDTRAFFLTPLKKKKESEEKKI